MHFQLFDSSDIVGNLIECKRASSPTNLAWSLRFTQYASLTVLYDLEVLGIGGEPRAFSWLASQMVVGFFLCLRPEKLPTHTVGMYYTFAFRDLRVRPVLERICTYSEAVLLHEKFNKKGFFTTPRFAQRFLLAVNVVWIEP